MLEFTHIWVFWLLLLPLLVNRFAPAYVQRLPAVYAPFMSRWQQAAAGVGSFDGSVGRLLVQRLMLPITWLLIVSAAARPVWLPAPETELISASELLIAVDLSDSMSTRDFRSADGSDMDRLQAVKNALNSWLAARQGDRLALLVFGEAAYVQVPFTLNRDSFLQLLNETRTGMAGDKTMIGDAIGLAISMFSESDTVHKRLLLFTDGTDSGSSVPPVEAAKVAARKGIEIYPVVLGSQQTDGSYRLDLEVVQMIADITGTQLQLADSGAQLGEIYRAFDQFQPAEYRQQVRQPRLELYHYLLLLMLVLNAAMHAGLIVRNLLRSRRG